MTTWFSRSNRRHTSRPGTESSNYSVTIDCSQRKTVWHSTSTYQQRVQLYFHDPATRMSTRELQRYHNPNHPIVKRTASLSPQRRRNPSDYKRPKTSRIFPVRCRTFLVCLSRRIASREVTCAAWSPKATFSLHSSLEQSQLIT